MNPDGSPPHEKKWTAAELRKLPANQRDAILAAAAALAEEIYRNDPQLTDLEAFGEEDFYWRKHRRPRGVKSGWCSSGPRWERESGERGRVKGLGVVELTTSVFPLRHGLLPKTSRRGHYFYKASFVAPNHLP